MTAPCRHSHYGMTFVPLTAESGLVLLTWYLRDSRASPSPPQELGAESMTSETCGPRPSGSFARYDLASSFWKMSQGSFLPDTSEPCSVIWPRAGSMRNGSCWERTTVERPTGGSDCGSSPFLSPYPTPSSTPYGSSGNGTGNNVGSRGRPSLDSMAKRGMWPTPNSSDHIEKRTTHAQGNLNLQGAVGGVSERDSTRHWPTPDANVWKGGERRGQLTDSRFWPTPTTGDARSSRSRNTEGSQAHPGLSLTDAIRADGGKGRGATTRQTWASPTKRDAQSLAKVKRGKGSKAAGQERIEPLPVQAGGSLNPDWVEWLLGWPIAWSALAPSETDRFLWWLRQHSAF